MLSLFVVLFGGSGRLRGLGVVFWGVCGGAFFGGAVFVFLFFLGGSLFFVLFFNLSLHSELGIILVRVTVQPVFSPLKYNN